MAKQRVYIGSFTPPGDPDRGIWLCAFDPATGELSVEAGFAAGASPAYLAWGQAKRYLYCINEVAQFEGQPGGGVSAFAVDPRDGSLSALNHQSSEGAIPCYLALDTAARWALVANYTGGNASLLPLGADGRLGSASHVVRHQGSGPNSQRQEAAHPHSVQMAPWGGLVLVADLGLDQLRLYDLDEAGACLRPHAPAALALHPGAGPRHFDFHPNGRWLYVLNELDSTLDTFAIDAARAFTWRQSLSTLPAEGFAGENWPADVHVHPDGRYVLACNRGHNSLALFALDADGGAPRLVACVPGGGRMPLNFSFDPSGRWVIVANQASNNLAVFAFDAAAGQLTPAGTPMELPSPTCVRF